MNKMNHIMVHFIRCKTNSLSLILLLLILKAMIESKNKEKNKIWIRSPERFGKRYATPNLYRSDLTSENPNENHEDYSFIVAWQMDEKEEWVVS